MIERALQGADLMIEASRAYFRTIGKGSVAKHNREMEKTLAKLEQKSDRRKSNRDWALIPAEVAL